VRDRQVVRGRASGLRGGLQGSEGQNGREKGAKPHAGQLKPPVSHVYRAGVVLRGLAVRHPDCVACRGHRYADKFIETSLKRV